MSFLIGVWPWLWHVGGATLTIAGLAALAVYVPILRKPAIALAIALGFGLGGYAIGDRNGADRVQAKWDYSRAETDKKVDDAVRSATSPRSGRVRRNDKWDSDTY